MKKNKKKIILALSLILFFLTVVLITSLKKKTEGASDYKIGILADDGIAMVSISKERQMVNYLSLSADSQIWIPGGMGWYRNQVLKRILVEEKKTDLIREVLFYNFGFVADKIVMLNKTDNWQQKFWWLLFRKNNLIRKTEKIDGDIDTNEIFLDKIMLRDFSETKIVNDDLKLSVINLSNMDGLANFISERLERAGFSVISVDGNDDEISENCRLLYADGVEKSFSWLVLGDIFEKCEVKNDSSLNEGEVEIYLNEKFAEMIKYPTYKK